MSSLPPITEPVVVTEPAVTITVTPAPYQITIPGRTLSGLATLSSTQIGQLASALVPALSTVFAPITTGTGTSSPPPPPAGNALPTGVVPIAWFSNGVLVTSPLWGTDQESYGGGTVQYGVADAAAPGGLCVQLTNENWQPDAAFSPLKYFNCTGFNYLQFLIKVNETTQMLVGASMAGDQPIPGGPGDIDITPYIVGGGTLVPNQWVSVKIPLHVLGINSTATTSVVTNILKFGFQWNTPGAPAPQITRYANVCVSP